MSEPSTRRVLGVFLALVAFTQLSFHRELFGQNNGNVWARLATTLALVEDGTPVIDRFAENTPDWSRHERRFYSNKAPGPALLATPGYALQHVVQGWLDVDEASTRARNVSLYVANATTAVLPTLVALALLFGVLRRRFALAPLAALGISAAWGVGSLALPYSITWFGHQSAAAFLAIGMCLTLDAGARAAPGTRPGPRRLALAGLMLGLAVACDYLTGILVVVWTAWLFLDSREPGRGGLLRGLRAHRTALGAFVLAGLVPALGLALYHAACFGSPLRTPYDADVLNPRFVAQNTLTWPSLDRLLDLTVRPYRGLFYATPLWILIGVGLDRLRRERDGALVAAAVGVTLVFAWLACMPAAFGGFCLGPRYAVPALPMAALLLVPAVRLVPRLFAALLAISTATMLLGCVTDVLPGRAQREPFRAVLVPTLLGDRPSPQHSLLESLGWSRVECLVAYLLLWGLAWGWFAWRLRPATEPAIA